MRISVPPSGMPTDPGLRRAVDRDRRRDPAQLGQPVALVHVAAEGPLEVARDLDGHGGAADVGDPDRRQLVGTARRLAERDAHRRHAEQDRRPRRRHRRRASAPPRSAARRRSAAPAIRSTPARSPGRARARTARRRARRRPARAPCASAALRGCSADAAVREDGALRPPRGAGGEEDRGRHRRPRARRPPAFASAFPTAAARRTTATGAATREALLDLRRGEQRVQRHDDRAGAERAEERGDVVGGVRETTARRGRPARRRGRRARPRHSLSGGRARRSEIVSPSKNSAGRRMRGGVSDDAARFIVRDDRRPEVHEHETLPRPSRRDYQVA